VLEEDLCLAHLELVEICAEVSTPDNKGSEVRSLKVTEMASDENQPEFIRNIMNNVHPDAQGQ